MPKTNELFRFGTISGFIQRTSLTSQVTVRQLFIWFLNWDIRGESGRSFAKETDLVSSPRIVHLDLDLIFEWFEIEIFEPWSKLDSNNQITILKHNLYNELVSINGERDRNLWCIIQLGFHGQYYSFISRSKRTLVNPCLVNDRLFERNRCQMAWTDLGHCW